MKPPPRIEVTVQSSDSSWRLGAGSAPELGSSFVACQRTAREVLLVQMKPDYYDGVVEEGASGLPAAKRQFTNSGSS